MPSVIARLCIFVSSYFPLACIVAFLFWRSQRLLSLVVLITAALGLAGMLLYLRYAAALAPSLVVVERVERIDAEATSYIVTYFIPFLALPSDTWEHGAALIILYLVLCVLYVTANMIHINPMLNLLGYHLYEITVIDGGEYALISRRRVRRGEHVRVCSIGEGILLRKASSSRS